MISMLGCISYVYVLAMSGLRNERISCYFHPTVYYLYSVVTCWIDALCYYINNVDTCVVSRCTAQSYNDLCP